jgi:hypothetical protein
MDSLEGLLQREKTGEEQSAEVEESDEPSQEVLLERLSTLEAQQRQLTNKVLPPRHTILFGLARKFVYQAETPEQRSSMALWIRALDSLLEDERQSGVHDGSATKHTAKGTHNSTASRQPRASSGIDPSTIIQRVLKMTEWFHEQTGGRNVHQDLKHQLDLATQSLVIIPTAHERMQIAISLDRLQERMRQRFDMRKQSSNVP